jgi:hypothetical protein
LCKAQLQKRSRDATTSLKATLSPIAAVINCSFRFASGSTPRKDSTCRIQRLATALTVTTVVNNPAAIAMVVR